jgi:hypothetical protein
MSEEKERRIWVFYIFPTYLYTDEEKKEVWRYVLYRLSAHSFSESVSESVDDFITVLKKRLTNEIIPQLEEKYNIKARLSEKYPGKGTHILIAKNLVIRMKTEYEPSFADVDWFLDSVYKEYGQEKMPVPGKANVFTSAYECLAWSIPAFDYIIDPEPKRDDNSNLGELFLLLVGLTGAYFILRS